jgi:hypothetical protein
VRSTLILVAVLAVLGTVFALRDTLAAALYTRQVSSGSSGVLIAIESVGELETLAEVRRNVFPHDFLVPDTDIYTLLRRIEMSQRPLEEVLTPEERTHLAIAELAGRYGLATQSGQRGHVVITTVIRYGYDLAHISRLVAQAVADAAGQSVTIELPPASLLSLETEDISRDSYPWGTVPVSAEGIREISALIADAVQEPERTEELQLQAAASAAETLNRLTAGATPAVRFVPPAGEHR